MTMQRIFSVIFFLGVFAGEIFSGSARGALNEIDRSVEQTGEALPAGRFEVGFAKVMYGLSDSLMVETNPGFDLLAGYSLGVTKKISLARDMRITPYFRYFGLRNLRGRFSTWRGGTTVGLNRGARKQHSFAVSIAGKSEPYLSWGKGEDDAANQDDPGQPAIENGKRKSVWMGFDYSYYTEAGNLAYVGSDMMVPYAGFTWAWENIHAGFLLVEVNSWTLRAYVPASLPKKMNFSIFLPLPYLFFRF